MKLTNQQKGSLLAFIAVMFITPDSLFIRLSHIDTWGLLFYRGAIPFVAVFFGLLMIYRTTFFKLFFAMGYPGIFYTITFAITNITFIISIQNTNVANTLIMIAMAPMLSAVLGALFLKENLRHISLDPCLAYLLSFFLLFSSKLMEKRSSWIIGK